MNESGGVILEIFQLTIIVIFGHVEFTFYQSFRLLIQSSLQNYMEALIPLNVPIKMFHLIQSFLFHIISENTSFEKHKHCVNFVLISKIYGLKNGVLTTLQVVTVCLILESKLPSNACRVYFFFVGSPVTFMFSPIAMQFHPSSTTLRSGYSFILSLNAPQTVPLDVECSLTVLPTGPINTSAVYCPPEPIGSVTLTSSSVQLKLVQTELQFKVGMGWSSGENTGC